MASHMSVFKTLENSELNHRGMESPKGFKFQFGEGSFSSWQSIKMDNQALSGGDTSGEGRSANSILSLSSDNEDGKKLELLHNHGLEPPQVTAGMMEDSEDEGTFEIDVNALINTGTAKLTRSNLISPSFIMPKVMVTSKSGDAGYLRICVIGNGLNKIQKELLSKLNEAFQYVFTNLNSKVDLILLVFDGINGLYSKDLFNILSSYNKFVLPVLYDKKANLITSGGITDDEDRTFNESMITTLLMNNGIRIFNSPVKIENDESFDPLHEIIYGYYKFNDEFAEDQEDDVIQSTTSTWASTIIQSQAADESFKISQRKRKMSNSSNNSKVFKKKSDKKRLSFSKINNSDPLKLNEKKGFVLTTVMAIGVGLSLVTALASYVWYNKAGQIPSQIPVQPSHVENLNPLVYSTKKMIHHTKLLMIRSLSYMNEVLEDFPGLMLLC